MKKILFTVWCSLMVAFTMNAQTSSGNEIIDEMLKVADEIASSYEKEFASQGLKSEIHIFFDAKQNEFVQSIRVFSQEIFDVMNTDNGLAGGITGMINAVQAEDNTGNVIVWIGNEFKRTNTGMRVECLYGNQKKASSATADQIIEIIYNTFQ